MITGWTDKPDKCTNNKASVVVVDMPNEENEVPFVLLVLFLQDAQGRLPTNMWKIRDAVVHRPSEMVRCQRFQLEPSHALHMPPVAVATSAFIPEHLRGSVPLVVQPEVTKRGFDQG